MSRTPWHNSPRDIIAVLIILEDIARWQRDPTLFSEYSANTSPWRQGMRQCWSKRKPPTPMDTMIIGWLARLLESKSCLVLQTCRKETGARLKAEIRGLLYTQCWLNKQSGNRWNGYGACPWCWSYLVDQQHKQYHKQHHTVVLRRIQIFICISTPHTRGRWQFLVSFVLFHAIQNVTGTLSEVDCGRGHSHGPFHDGNVFLPNRLFICARARRQILHRHTGAS